MRYEVRILRAAEKEMDNIPPHIHTRISGKILSLGDDPRPRAAKKLSGLDEYRIRLGDYRVLYTIDDEEKSVTIFAVGHRREIYR